MARRCYDRILPDGRDIEPPILLKQELYLSNSLTYRADAWGSKSELWLSVVINWVGFVLCSVLLRYPQYYNYPRSVAEERLPQLHQLGQELMAWTILSLSLLLLYPASCMLLVCPSMSVWIVFVGLSLTFGGMGYYFYKCYRLGD